MTNPTSKRTDLLPSDKNKNETTSIIPLSSRRGVRGEVKKLQTAIDQYFSGCDTATKEIYVKSSGTIEQISSPRPYTLEGLSLATGITREQLLQYELHETNPKRRDIISQAKLRIQENIINRAFQGEANSTITTFILKNNFGYKDKTEQDPTGKDDENTLNPIHVKVIRTKNDLR